MATDTPQYPEYQRDTVRLKIPPLLLTVFCAALMTALSWALPQFDLSIPVKNIIAISFAVVGAAICGMGVASFRRMQTTMNPGKPDQSSSLVMNGIYRVSRNPMYLGFVLLLIAWGVYLAHALAVLLVPPTFVVYLNRYQIAPEEEALGQLFGEEFVSYKSIVGRWL